ncbi:MAG TPA: type VI secretion system baseplate subunit TssK [Pseudomonadota bacterium]|nr:type VI secretion system baseplate subunit TssK [Pseudomonadota bacterium]
MSTLKIAPVRWFLGQTVLPEHFVALQQGIDSAVEFRARTCGLPMYGVAQLSYNESLLRDGVLALGEVSAVLADGVIISVPGNCSLAPLSLAATSATRVSVYLHVLSDAVSGQGNRTYDSDPRVVERVVQRAVLSINDSVEGSRAVLRLGDFEKGVAGSWALTPTYVPPLLQVGNTPHLLPALATLEAQVGALEPQLAAQLQDTFLRPDRLSTIRRCLAALYRMQTLLVDLRSRVPMHPYDVHAALRELYWEACCFHEVVPDQPVLPYRHDSLASCFGTVLRLLQQALRPVYARSTHLRFSRSNGLFTLSGLPSELKDAQEVYLLVQRPTLHERIAMEDIKLSCTSRLALVHRLVLRGVPYKYVERPPFQHTFGPEVDFYQLQSGDEWDHALRESSVALYVHPVLERANVFLYWR